MIKHSIHIAIIIPCSLSELSHGWVVCTSLKETGKLHKPVMLAQAKAP